ncbi:hypothetical protein KK425_17900 [Clostridioides difficile]|nr:hypothetical protein [Clostridioides difficile]
MDEERKKLIDDAEKLANIGINQILKFRDSLDIENIKYINIVATNLKPNIKIATFWVVLLCHIFH